MKHIALSDIIDSSERKYVLENSLDDRWLDILVEYPAVFWSAKVLRDLVIDASEYFHLDRTWTSRLTLIADELNNNSIEYGSNEGDYNTMRLQIATKNNKVDFVIEVEDTGKGIGAKTVAEMEELRSQKEGYDYGEHTSIRGRGLFLIIKQIVDELYFQDSPQWWLLVWIKKEIDLDSL